MGICEVMGICGSDLPVPVGLSNKPITEITEDELLSDLRILKPYLEHEGILFSENTDGTVTLEFSGSKK